MRGWRAILLLVVATASCHKAPDAPPVHARADVADVEADAADWPAYGGQAQ